MLSKISSNELLKKYKNKPKFVTDRFLSDCKTLILKNKTKEFQKLIIIKKLGSEKIFHIYFYIEYCLEKENKSSEFLEQFIFSKLYVQYMQIIPDIIIDKQIYIFLKKNYKDFKEINKKDKLFVVLDKEYLKLLDLLERVDDNSKTIEKDSINLIEYLKKLIKLKKINKKIAEAIISRTAIVYKKPIIFK